MTTLPAHLSKVAIVEKRQRREREEAEILELSLPEYVADTCIADRLGFTIDIPCDCGGTGILAKHNGNVMYCHCAEGLEAAMREQVELMTAYAESMRLQDEARRLGHALPFTQTEYHTIQWLFDAAQAEHDRLETRWELLYQ